MSVKSKENGAVLFDAGSPPIKMLRRPLGEWCSRVGSARCVHENNFVTVAVRRRWFIALFINCNKHEQGIAFPSVKTIDKKVVLFQFPSSAVALLASFFPSISHIYLTNDVVARLVSTFFCFFFFFSFVRLSV